MLDQNKDLASIAMVFDREACNIPFFKQLRNEYRIAVLTYRKAVKEV